MKRKIILAIAAMMILGLAVVAFAFTRTGSSVAAPMACCCNSSGDSCPMKSKDAKTSEKASCCDDCDCCKGDSCPMMKKGEAKQDAAAEGKTCDCSCCKSGQEKKDTQSV